MNASFGSGSSSYDWETLFGSYRYDTGTGLYQVRYRYYHTGLGRWLSRDPINEPGQKLLRGGIRPLKLREELALYGYVANDPVNGLDLLGLGHNFGRCCNYSGGYEWALEGGKWTKLKPGECTGVFGDCSGMTCGGGFYYVLGLEGGTCKTPGCDSPSYTNRR